MPSDKGAAAEEAEEELRSAADLCVVELAAEAQRAQRVAPLWAARVRWERPTQVPGSLNNSVNDPSGARNASKVPSVTAPGTNSLGTANSTGSSRRDRQRLVGVSDDRIPLNRSGGQSGGRIDGTTKRSDMLGDDEVRGEDRTVDKKIKSICKGC